MHPPEDQNTYSALLDSRCGDDSGISGIYNEYSRGVIFIGQKLTENAKMAKIQMRHFW